MLEHLHLLVQGTATKLLSESDIKNFTLDLIQKIGMDILGGPHTYRSDIKGNEGYTAITAITTSHIVIHTWDTGLVQLDVYSCKKFEILDITELLEKLCVSDIQIKFLDRSNGFKNIEVLGNNQ